MQVLNSIKIVMHYFLALYKLLFCYTGSLRAKHIFEEGMYYI